MRRFIRAGRVDAEGLDEMRAARRNFETFVATAAFESRAPAALATARDALVGMNRWLDEPLGRLPIPHPTEE